MVEKAVQFALAQVGKPYVWGTEGPDTFDCSGLIFAAFRHAGIKVTRTTWTQIRDGSAVSQTSIARGDLWFTDPGHVAIYLGNGMMVEAPNSRSRVRVVPVRKFFAARRLGTPSTVSGPQGSTVPVLSFGGINDAVTFLTDKHMWVRVLTILAGVALLGIVVQGALLKQVGKVV